MDIYKKYKTNINVSRRIHQLLKSMKKDNETFNDVLTRLLKDDGYLWDTMMIIKLFIMKKMIGI